jgi:hypothetical protein
MTVAGVITYFLDKPIRSVKTDQLVARRCPLATVVLLPGLSFFQQKRDHHGLVSAWRNIE